MPLLVFIDDLSQLLALTKLTLLIFDYFLYALVAEPVVLGYLLQVKTFVVSGLEVTIIAHQHFHLFFLGLLLPTNVA